jgi:hypothetical protein
MDNAQVSLGVYDADETKRTCPLFHLGDLAHGQRQVRHDQVTDLWPAPDTCVLLLFYQVPHKTPLETRRVTSER